jgi:hypothetical protein
MKTIEPETTGRCTFVTVARVPYICDLAPEDQRGEDPEKDPCVTARDENAVASTMPSHRSEFGITSNPLWG